MGTGMESGIGKRLKMVFGTRGKNSRAAVGPRPSLACRSCELVVAAVIDADHPSDVLGLIHMSTTSVSGCLQAAGDPRA